MASKYLEPGWVELFKSQVDNTEETGPREVMKPGKSLSKGTILKLGGDKNYKIKIPRFLNPAPRDSRYRWMLTTYKNGAGWGRQMDGKEIIFELIYNKTNGEVTLKEFDPEKEQRKQAWLGEHDDDDLVTGRGFGGGGFTFNDRENNSDIVHNIKKKKRKSKKQRKKTRKRKSKRKKHKTKRRKS